MARTALELIGQSGLGYSFDPLTEDDASHPFSNAVKLLVYVDPLDHPPSTPLLTTITRPTLCKMEFSRSYLLTISLKFGTPKFRRFVMNILPWKNLHEVRDIVDVLDTTAIEIIEGKQKALEEGDEAVTQQISNGNDIISILSAYRLLP